MSLGHAPWCERLVLITLLSLSACGGKIADDGPSLQEQGGSGLVETGGTTVVYSLEPAGGRPASGGAPATGGDSMRASGGRGFGGSQSAQLGGAQPVTGGSRALGGSPATGGRKSTGGANSTNVAGSFGGVLASGGLRASGGKPGSGGSQAQGGTDANTSPASGGSSATGDVCVMPPDAGSCDAYFQSYYFNPFHGRCEPFMYGGCGGNANRFDSVQACEKRCTQSGCPLVIPPSSPIWTCPLSAACYYQLATSCRCRAENGGCNTDSTCTAEDAGADASTEQLDAGDSTNTPLPVVLCTCGSSSWICRVIDLLAP